MIKTKADALYRLTLVEEALSELRESLGQSKSYGFDSEWTLASKAQRECRNLLRWINSLDK